jgi:hypothetical protein
MQEVVGYYKDKKVNIKIDAESIKIGTKTIKASEIYHIREVYLTSYANIFINGCIVACFVIGLLAGILLTNTFSTAWGIIFALVAFIVTYYLTRKKIVQDNPDAYLKLIEIMSKDDHETILVPNDFNIEMKTNTKNVWQKNVLNRYTAQIKKSYKYLTNQIETNDSLSDDAIYQKYSTVAKEKYQQKNLLSKKMISIIKENYNHVLKPYTKFGFRCARFAIIMILVLVFYAFWQGDNLRFSTFF